MKREFLRLVQKEKGTGHRKKYPMTHEINSGLKKKKDNTLTSPPSIIK